MNNIDITYLESFNYCSYCNLNILNEYEPICLDCLELLNPEFNSKKKN